MCKPALCKNLYNNQHLQTLFLGGKMSYDGLLCYRAGELLNIIVREKAADKVVRELMQNEHLREEEWNDRYTTAGLTYCCACNAPVSVKEANNLEKLAKSLNLRIVTYDEEPNMPINIDELPTHLDFVINALAQELLKK